MQKQRFCKNIFNILFLLGSDERYFKEVLRPGKRLAVNQTGSPGNGLMFEVHYRDSPTRTTMTFIFNNSRITLLLDAILDIYNFIMTNWDRQGIGITRLLGGVLLGGGTSSL